MKKGNIKLSARIRKFINMGHDKASELETSATIENGVDFQGAKLWILVLAIFVASLGLNTNSTAVIIGAMLISPLMGPIIGMGYSIGVYDFALLKRAFRNYLIATIFSVATATLYFLISPMPDAQSELLARTSPSFYDVCIALFGGLAGIIGLSSKSQRTGNVIPGVAIATALMPPLCTVGFGLAKGEWVFAAGAFYLYTINTIFIALSTLIGVSFMGFHKQALLDGKKQKNVKRIISFIAILTIVPSIVFSITSIQKAFFESRAHRFIQNEFNFEKSPIVREVIDYENQSIKIVVVGQEIDSSKIAKAKGRLSLYKLGEVSKDSVIVLQESAGMLKREHQLIINHKDEMKLIAGQLALTEDSLRQAQQLLTTYKEAEKQAEVILPDLKVLYPEVQSLSLASGFVASDTSDVNSHVDHIAIVRTSKDIDKERNQGIQVWLRGRTIQPHLRVIIENANSTKK